MGQISQWFGNELIKLSFNRDSYTPAWNQFQLAALLNEPVVETDTTMLVEPIGLGYARQVIPFNTASWIVGQMGEVSNVNSALFPAATGTWGKIVGYALIAISNTGAFTPVIAAYCNIPMTPRILTGDQLLLPANSFFFGIFDSQ